MNEKSPNNRYTRDKKKRQKRASLDNGICEICGEEFRATYNLDKGLSCELIWVQFEGETVLACDNCKNEQKNAK